MKTTLSILTLAAIALSLPAPGLAADMKTPKEKATEPVKKPAEKAPEMAKEAPAKIVGEGATIPMHTRADAIDAKAKTFTMTRRDGVAVKHMLTAETTIMNGEAPAKMGEIKVGDYVNGLRKKKSETEYEVVKITSFGPAPAKKLKVEDEKKMN